MITSTIIIILFALFASPLFASGSVLGAFAWLAIGLGAMGFTYGPGGTTLAEMFPTNVRYTGASLAFNLAGILGASFAPMIATKLGNAYGLQAVGYYLAVAATLTLLALLFVKPHKEN